MLLACVPAVESMLRSRCPGAGGQQHQQRSLPFLLHDLKRVLNYLHGVQLHDLALQRDVMKTNSAKFRGTLHAKPAARDRISRPEAASGARYGNREVA